MKCATTVFYDNNKQSYTMTKLILRCFHYFQSRKKKNLGQDKYVLSNSIACLCFVLNVRARKYYRRERVCTVELLVLITLDYNKKIYFFTKEATLNEEAHCNEPSPLS